MCLYPLCDIASRWYSSARCYKTGPKLWLLGWKVLDHHETVSGIPRNACLCNWTMVLSRSVNEKALPVLQINTLLLCYGPASLVTSWPWPFPVQLSHAWIRTLGSLLHLLKERLQSSHSNGLSNKFQVNGLVFWPSIRFNMLTNDCLKSDTEGEVNFHFWVR